VITESLTEGAGIWIPRCQEVGEKGKKNDATLHNIHNRKSSNRQSPTKNDQEPGLKWRGGRKFWTSIHPHPPPPLTSSFSTINPTNFFSCML